MIRKTTGNRHELWVYTDGKKKYFGTYGTRREAEIIEGEAKSRAKSARQDEHNRRVFAAIATVGDVDPKFARYQAAAHALGMSLDDWIRNACDAAIEYEDSAPQERARTESELAADNFFGGCSCRSSEIECSLHKTEPVF